MTTKSMDEQISDIRCKAFEEEIRIVISEYCKSMSKEGMSAMLDKYLRKYFVDYIYWRLITDPDKLTFFINIPYRLYCKPFVVELPYKN